MKDKKNRISEVISIRRSLDSIKVDTRFPEMQNVIKDLNTFINDGVSLTNTYKFPEVNATIRIILTVSENKKSGVELIQ